MTAKSITERPPHQQRVLHEQMELKYKTEKLSDFVKTFNYAALEFAEREDLAAQLHAMKIYLEILDRRIVRFDEVAA